MEELASGLIDAFVGVGAEVVALGLEQICGEAFGAVAVEEGEGGAEGGNGDAALSGDGDDVAPAFLAVTDFAFEIGVQQERLEARMFVVGILDFAEEGAADDAAAAPHHGDAAVVEVPVVFLGGGAQEHKALCVADNFGGIKRATDVLDEFRPLAGNGGFWAADFFAGLHALVFLR